MYISLKLYMCYKLMLPYKQCLFYEYMNACRYVNICNTIVIYHFLLLFDRSTFPSILVSKSLEEKQTLVNYSFILFYSFFLFIYFTYRNFPSLGIGPGPSARDHTKHQATQPSPRHRGPRLAPCRLPSCRPESMNSYRLR